MGLAGRLIKSSFFRVSNMVAAVIVTLFMMPFVIGHIGDRWYGLWVLAGSFTGYFGFLDLGLSTANERFLSQALGKNDTREIDRIFNTCLFLFFVAGCVAIVAAMGIVAATPLFVRNPKDVEIFRTVIMIVGLGMAVSFPARAFEGVLYANVRFYIVNIIDMVKLVVRTALLLVFLSRGYGIITLALISLGTEFLQHVAIAIVVLKMFPDLGIRYSSFTRERIRPLFGYSLYSFIANVGDKLKYHLDAFVITAALGLSLVTHYNIGSRIANYYILIITAATALVMPVFSTFEGVGDYRQIREKFLFLTKLNVIVSVFLGGTILIYGRAFILRWMGAGYLDAYGVLVVLMASAVFTTIQTTSKSLLYGLSRHRMYAITVIIEGVINLGLSLVLVRRYGIVGVALGTTIPALVVNCLILPVYANRVINQPLLGYARVALGALLVGTAVLVASWIAVRGLLEPSFLRIALLSAATSAVYLAVSGFVLLKKDERRYFGIPV